MFLKKNTCLCELIQCAGEESVGLYRQISTVKHPKPLIAVNLNSNKSKSKILHVKKCYDFDCDAVDLFNSVFSIHTLVLVTFILIIFTKCPYYGVVEMVNVNKCRFGSDMWIMVTVRKQLLMLLGLQ
jgi:glutamate formiminotransferase